MILFITRILKLIIWRLESLERKLFMLHLKKHFPEDYKQINDLLESINLAMKNGPLFEVKTK